MLGAIDPVAFVPVGDVARSRAFYTGILGLEAVADTPFGVVLRAGDTTVRLTPVPDFRPAQGTVLGWEVADLDPVLRDLVAAGVTPLHFPGFDQDHHGVWDAPGGARIVWFADPDGNVLSLTQP